MTTAYELIGLGGNVTEVVVPGLRGPVGPAANGVPAGGTTGQQLVKLSGGDYDTGWADDGSLPIASEVEAVAGTDNTKVMTPLRTAQATAGLVPTTRSVTTGTGLTGGGDLSINRNIVADLASQPESEAGASSTKLMTPLGVAQAITARLNNTLSSTSTTLALTAAQGKVLENSKIGTGRQILAGTGLSGGGNLSADRTLSADIASQPEAEAGAINTKLMTPLRVAQAVALKVDQSRTISAGTGLSGGGDLSANRTISADIASTVEAQALTSNVKLMTPLRVGEAIANVVLNTRQVIAGTALNGGGALSSNVTINATLASQAEAEAGDIGDKLLTPLRVAQQTTARLASNGEAIAGTNNVKLMTPLRSADYVTARLASNAEALAGTNNVKLMTPLRVNEALAAATAIGSSVIAGTALTGGGPISSDVTLNADIASDADALAGASNVKLMTPLRVTAQTTYRLASNAEAIAGTDNVKLMTPLRVKEVIGSPAQSTVTISAGTALTGGGDLTANRTISADLASQAEAEAGASSTKLMTPQRVLQHVNSRLNDTLTSTSTSQALTAAQGKILQDNKIGTTRTISAGTGLTGGGDMSANRTISADIASQGEAQAGTSNVKLMTPLRVAEAIEALPLGVPVVTVSGARTIIASDRGKMVVNDTGGFTLPSGLPVGFAVSLFNSNGSGTPQTITQGAGTTLRLAGTSLTGNRTLGVVGLASAVVVSTNTWAITGAGLT